MSAAPQQAHRSSACLTGMRSPRTSGWYATGNSGHWRPRSSNGWSRDAMIVRPRRRPCPVLSIDARQPGPSGTGFIRDQADRSAGAMLLAAAEAAGGPSPIRMQAAVGQIGGASLPGQPDILLLAVGRRHSIGRVANTRWKASCKPRYHQPARIPPITLTNPVSRTRDSKLWKRDSCSKHWGSAAPWYITPCGPCRPTVPHDGAVLVTGLNATQERVKRVSV